MRAAATVLGILLALAAVADAAPGRTGYLTGPQSGDPLEIALRVLQQRGAGAAATAPDYAQHRVADRYRSVLPGTTHIVLRQVVAGIEVWNGDAMVNIAPDGAVLNVHDRFVAAAQATTPRPGLTPEEAVARAAAVLGLDLRDPPVLLDTKPGPALERSYRCPGLSLDDVPLELMYWADARDQLHLVWNLIVREPSGEHWWDLNLDAATGEVRSQVDWRWDDAYRVFALPLESPDDGPRTLEVDPADPVASPFGWHDANGIPGPEGNTTTGNAAVVDADVDADDVLDQASPAGAPGLVFDLPLDLGQPAASNLEAAITNAFYWTNVNHDIHYHYGFDEESGNFQISNYGAPGGANDPIVVHVQDGALRNNAQIQVPPDGLPALLELYLFDPRPGLEVTSPTAVARRYKAAGAVFGPELESPTASAEVALAADGVAPFTDACSTLTNGAEISGRIALIDRGQCFFVEKALNAQAAGAVGVIIANNVDDSVFTMGQATPPQPDPLIPSIMIGLGDGIRLKTAVGQPLVASLEPPGPDRDSALDNGLLIHEYGHGISTRRTGGPANAGCLEDLQSNGMGEGWSDFWAIALTGRATDLPTDLRTIAAYVLSDSQPVGLRNFPYSTNLAANPLTFGALSGLSEEHDVGEIWTSALWEVYWNLIAEQGFDPDWIGGSGGNNTTLQLVMDALPLQPCNPTLLDGRDAILLADLALSGGANECAIWRGFAKRGMGVSADDGGAATTNQVTEAFDVPLQCPEPSAGLLALATLAATAVAARKRVRDGQETRRSARTIASSGRDAAR